MKIIRPYAKLLPLPGCTSGIGTFDEKMGLELLKRIEWSARISHRTEDSPSVTDASWERFIKAVVLDHGDWSVVEHAVVSVDAVMDRGITHEWVRHRLFGFTQQSTRFVNHAKKLPPSFIYPQVEVECEHCLRGEESQPPMGQDPIGCIGWYHDKPLELLAPLCAYHPAWLYAVQTSEDNYRNLLDVGWRPQEARSVFPNALSSRIVTTGNLRNWRHFLIMRTCAEAHPQMRQLTVPLLKEFQVNIPLLFDDIEPGEKQSSAIQKAR